MGNKTKQTKRTKIKRYSVKDLNINVRVDAKYAYVANAITNDVKNDANVVLSIYPIIKPYVRVK